VPEKIINCYDSHTHFWATGQVAEGLQLHHLKSAASVRDIQIQPSYFRSHWLTGFGWNHHQWIPAEFPDSKILDEAFGITPVFFSRVDGHASWVNSAAISELRNAGFDFSKDPEGGKIGRYSNGEPSGLLFDSAHIRALSMLPDFSPAQHRLFFETSQKIFNRAGFTHVRDLSMNLGAWTLLRTMEEQKTLTVALDAFVTAENLQDLGRVFEEIKIIAADPSEQMRLHGVKIFIDGSLGSKTAHLSQPYPGELHNGLLIWSIEDIKQALRRTWQAGLQLAIHTIGDQAAHLAVGAAREVSAEGIAGRLHLEHVQCLRPETIQMMKPIHVTCYLQPCHWLSDHPWLAKTLPAELVPYLFQWEQLRKNKIPFFFGSDSPIEPVSLTNNRLALLQSASAGIPALEGSWSKYHSHPDRAWCPSFTEYDEERGVTQVYFRDQPLL
jgi:predicted amidohydrolase YtcJ